MSVDVRDIVCMQILHIIIQISRKQISLMQNGRLA